MMAKLVKVSSDSYLEFYIKTEYANSCSKLELASKILSYLLVEKEKKDTNKQYSRYFTSQYKSPTEFRKRKLIKFVCLL